VDQWAEIGDCDHLVQFYDDSQALVETLTGFIGGALRAGGAGVVIATRAHLDALEQQLAVNSIDIAAAKQSRQYIALDAAETLAGISANRWPQPARFQTAIGSPIREARTRWGSVRAFGEMVGLLWEGGAAGAAIRLEGMWNELARSTPFALLCGYHVE